MTAGRTVVPLSQDWSTPPKYVEAVRSMFDGRIGLDPCSNRHSIVHAEVEYCLPATDGLRERWDAATIYVNPPYGADRSRGTTIKDWLRRCALAREECGAEVLALVPVATNTKHWKNYVWGVADAACFLYDTRLKFLVDGKDEGKGAPMSCAMVYWGRHVSRFENIFLQHGAVLDLRQLHGKPLGVEPHAERMLFAANNGPSPAPR